MNKINIKTSYSLCRFKTSQLVHLIIVVHYTSMTNNYKSSKTFRTSQSNKKKHFFLGTIHFLYQNNQKHVQRHLASRSITHKRVLCLNCTSAHSSVPTRVLKVNSSTATAVPSVIVVRFLTLM